MSDETDGPMEDFEMPIEGGCRFADRFTIYKINYSQFTIRDSLLRIPLNCWFAICCLPTTFEWALP